MSAAIKLPDDSTCKTSGFTFTVNNKLLQFSEEQLVTGLRQRKTHILSYLYDHYAAALNGIIYSTVKNRECSEDLLQEVFIKIWYNISMYDSNKGRLYTWMITVALNHSYDHVRSKSYCNRKKTGGQEKIEQSLYPNIYRADKYDAIGIKKSIDKLKPAYVQLINMAYYSGMSQSEIAKQLHMPLGTVKTKLRNAILALRKNIT